MLLFASFSFILVSSCLYIHYQQHFRLTVCDCFRKHKKGCFCQLLSKNNKEFDFFPKSFLFYMVFLVFICILTIIVQILYIIIENESTLSVIFFSLSFNSYHQHSINEIHKIHFSNSHGSYTVCVYIIDHLLIYGIMVLSIWESLFSFYRFYTAVSSTEYLTIPSIRDVFQRFTIYGILFMILFVIEIQLNYYMFPFVVLCHFFFNLYCTSRFSSMLINKYKMTESSSNQLTVLKSVIFIRKVSIISYLLQSIYLALFLITYNINTIYYLPVLWSISCCILTVNFIRNREYLIQKYKKLRQLFCCIIQSKHVPRPSLLNDDGNKTKKVINIPINDIKIDTDDKKTETELKVLDILGVSTPDVDDTITNLSLISLSEVVINKNKPLRKLKVKYNHSDNTILVRAQKIRPIQPSIKHSYRNNHELKPLRKIMNTSSMPARINGKGKANNNGMEKYNDIDFQSSVFNFIDLDYDNEGTKDDDLNKGDKFEMIEDEDFGSDSLPEQTEEDNKNVNEDNFKI